jgi:hypothetical protein
MAYDVARVRGLHSALGDGWIRFDAQAGMVVPEAVATAVSTAFRGTVPNTSSPHPAAQRSVVLLDAARRAIADMVGADASGVVLGADRAVLLTALADASSNRAGLGNEVVVSRLADEANIAPWLRAADRYGARVKWSEVDIETGELPIWQWEDLLTPDTRLVAIQDSGDRADIAWRRDDVTPLTTASQAGARTAYTVVADASRRLSLLVFNPADGGRTLNSYPLPEAAGFPVGVSVGFDRRVVAATSGGQVYSFDPA